MREFLIVIGKIIDITCRGGMPMRAPGARRRPHDDSQWRSSGGGECVSWESPAVSTFVSASESERSSRSSLLDRLRSPTVSDMCIYFK